MIAMGPLLRLLFIAINNNNVFTFLLQRTDLQIYVLPFSYVDAFAMGGYFALYKKSDKTNFQTLGLIYLSIFLGYFTQYASTHHIDFLTLGYRQYMQDQPVLGYSIINFVFAKVIMQIKDRKFFPLLIENRFFNYLGKISYGLYIFHHSIIWLIGYIDPSLTNLPLALISFLLTVAISSLVYEVYEIKFLKLKDTYFSKTMQT